MGSHLQTGCFFTKKTMKKNFILLILWSLLCASCVAHLIYHYNQYGIVSSLESLYELRPSMTNEDKATLENLRTSKSDHGGFLATSVMELMLLSGMGIILFLHRKPLTVADHRGR